MIVTFPFHAHQLSRLIPLTSTSCPHKQYRGGAVEFVLGEFVKKANPVALVTVDIVETCCRR